MADRLLRFLFLALFLIGFYAFLVFLPKLTSFFEKRDAGVSVPAAILNTVDPLRAFVLRENGFLPPWETLPGIPLYSFEAGFGLARLGTGELHLQLYPEESAENGLFSPLPPFKEPMPDLSFVEEGGIRLGTEKYDFLFKVDPFGWLDPENEEKGWSVRFRYRY